MSEDLGSFTYSSQPHSAPVKAVKKYRDNPHVPDETNLTLMSDPRVVRGSTYSMARKIAKSKAEFSKSLSMTQRKVVQHQVEAPASQPMYRFEVKPFSNEQFDVAQYLVEQNDLPVLKATKDNQTDEFVPRPPSPDYVPAKNGVDVGTQVDDVCELFDFEKEVAPMLDVIVMKTIEQSLFEVESEAELDSLEAAAMQFRAEKFKEEEWVKQREEQAVKDHANTRNHILALQQAREAEVRTKTAVAGVQMMKQILPHAFDTIAASNLANGLWQTPEAAAAEGVVLPSLLAATSERAAAHLSAQDVVDEILIGAEALYQTFPTYVEPQVGSSPVLTITFRAPPAEADSGEADGDEVAVATSSSVPAPFTALSVQIGPEDSIQSIERAIRAGIKKLKTDAAAAAEAAAGEGEEGTTGEASSAPVPPPPMVLPDSAALSGLLSLLSDKIIANIAAAQPQSPAAITQYIPPDATLYHFYLPAQIDVELVVA